MVDKYYNLEWVLKLDEVRKNCDNYSRFNIEKICHDLDILDDRTIIFEEIIRNGINNRTLKATHDVLLNHNQNLTPLPDIQLNNGTWGEGLNEMYACTNLAVEAFAKRICSLNISKNSEELYKQITTHRELYIYTATAICLMVTLFRETFPDEYNSLLIPPKKKSELNGWYFFRKHYKEFMDEKFELYYETIYVMEPYLPDPENLIGALNDGNAYLGSRPQ